MTNGEVHHIKPRSLFPELAKEKSNLIKLTYREHYICHWLLTKIYAEGIAHSKMVYAFWCFNSLNKHKDYTNSWAYKKNREEWCKLKWSEERRQKQSEAMKGKTLYEMTDDVRNRISETLKKKHANGEIVSNFTTNNPSKHMTEETKQKLSKVRKGMHNSEEHNKRVSEAMKGENNPMYGKSCYYKMSDEEQQSWRKNIKDAVTRSTILEQWCN